MTGASKGIGRAVASALAGAGARVFLLARSADVLHELAAALGPRAAAYPCDLLDPEQVGTVLSQIIADGGADILVNSAGVFPSSIVRETSVALFERTLAANLTVPFRLVRGLLPAMQAGARGHVVTIGSVADRHIYPGNGAYSASKFGARALHEVLREEARGTGVRVTLIAPAATDTPIWDSIDPDNTPGFPSRAAMLRADDVAEAVLWAVSRPTHVNVDELRLSRS